MKVNSIVSTLLLLVVPYVSSTTIGECKLICKEIRTDVLAVKGHCMSAMKQSPTPNLFNACVEGRKKAFDQACNPICSKSEVSVTSFQGCQASVKNKGHKFVSWCRKGYDSVLQNLEAALAEHMEKVKQDEVQQKSEEDVGVENERDLIQIETVETEESAVIESEPIEDESIHVRPVEVKEDSKVDVVDEAKGGLRGAYDEPEGSESVNDDIVLFEHETHEEEATTVIHMEYDEVSIKNEETNDDGAFEL